MAKNYEIKTMQKDIEGLKEKLKMPGEEIAEPLAKKSDKTEKLQRGKIPSLSPKGKKTAKKPKGKLILLIILIIIALLIICGFYYWWSYLR